MFNRFKTVSILAVLCAVIFRFTSLIWWVVQVGATAAKKYAGMPDDVVMFDGGHNIIKACPLNRNQDYEFPHALKQLTRAEYNAAIDGYGRDGTPDYVEVNGNYYVIGASATQYPDLQRVTGHHRYTRDYFGVFLAVMLFRMYKTGRDVAIYASYPTGDYDHRTALAKSIWGEWVITINGKTKAFNVKYVNTYEEARGGANNLILSNDGIQFEDRDINDGDALVIDIGGGTTDLRSVKDGKVTGLVARSLDLGAQNIETSFESLLLGKRDEGGQLYFAGYRTLPLDLLRQAIKTKRWVGGGLDLDVAHEVDQATNMLLTQLRQVYEAPLARKGCGGPMLWRYIILTGGASAMLHDYLLPILKHHRIVLAEKDIEKMQYANIHGGRKLWKLGYAKGWL